MTPAPAPCAVAFLSHRFRSHPQMVDEALQSVRAQTYPATELSVQFSERLWGNKWNDGIRATTAPYFVPLCDDDRLAPTYVAEVMAAAKGADLIVTDRVAFGDGEPDGGRIVPTFTGDYQQGHCYTLKLPWQDFKWGAAVPVTLGIRRAWFDSVGGYDPEMPEQDLELWYRAVRGGAVIRYLPRPLFWSRQHKDQWSKTNPEKLEALKAFHRKHFKDFRVLAEKIRPMPDGTFEMTHIETTPHDLATAGRMVA